MHRKEVHMPSVSIIVPIFNAEKYLEKTVGLLCSQTLGDIEIILVNDGSTDGSLKLCRKLAGSDRRIRLVTQQNKGVSSARNAGIAVACGEYIGFCDSDDLPDLDMYELLYSNAVRNNCDISAVRSRISNENGRVVNDISTGEFTLFQADNRSELMRAFLCDKFQSGVYTKLFKGELCKRLAFNSKIKINEDRLFLFDALLCAETVCLQSVTKYTYIRRRNSSSCADFSEKFFDTLTVSENIRETVQQEFPELKPYSEAFFAKARLSLLQHMAKSRNKGGFPSRYNEILQSLKALDRGFCKEHLTKNEYIKWSALKLGGLPFELLIKIFA